MKRIVLSTLMICAIGLTACSASSTEAGNELPIGTQLAVGILKLETPENEVTPEQAQALIILWQVYAELSQSDTAAQEEVDALIEQVQENLTAGQTQAIAAMELSPQDVFAAMQGFAVSSSSSSSSGNVTAPSGGMPAGGPPDGGGAPPAMGGGMPADLGGAGGLVTSTSQTPAAQAGSGLENSAGVPSALVAALIQFLEQKIPA